MKTFHQSILIQHSARQMLDIVRDVARYQEFLPLCHESTVLSVTETEMFAKVGLALGPLRYAFTTKNAETTTTDDGELSLDMTLVEGPFSHLQGRWLFTPVGDGDGQNVRSSCNVTLDLNYKIKHPLLNVALGTAFDKVVASLMNAFVLRAQKIYG